MTQKTPHKQLFGTHPVPGQSRKFVRRFRRKGAFFRGKRGLAPRPLPPPSPGKPPYWDFQKRGGSSRAGGVYGEFGGGEAPFTAKKSPLFGENAFNSGCRKRGCNKRRCLRKQIECKQTCTTQTNNECQSGCKTEGWCKKLIFELFFACLNLVRYVFFFPWKPAGRNRRLRAARRQHIAESPATRHQASPVSQGTKKTQLKGSKGHTRKGHREKHPENTWNYHENTRKTPWNLKKIRQFMTFSTFSLCPFWVCPLRLSNTTNPRIIPGNFGAFFGAKSRAENSKNSGNFHAVTFLDLPKDPPVLKILWRANSIRREKSLRR